MCCADDMPSTERHSCLTYNVTLYRRELPEIIAVKVLLKLYCLHIHFNLVDLRLQVSV